MVIGNTFGKATLGFGIVVSLAIIAVIAGLSGLTSTVIIAGGLYFVGLISAGTAQAIVLWLTVGVAAFVFFGGLIVYGVAALVAYFLG